MIQLRLISPVAIQGTTNLPMLVAFDVYEMDDLGLPIVSEEDQPEALIWEGETDHHGKACIGEITPESYIAVAQKLGYDVEVLDT